MLQRTLKRSTKLVVVLLGTLSALAPLPTNSLEYETLDSQKESSFYLDTNGHHGYHGLINEDENNVVVTPTIKVGGSELVCGFVIINRHRKNHEEFPFEILVDDQNAGTAKLRVRHRLNCEEKKSYQFNVQAISCSGSYSESVGVHVLVQDVNEYAPEWVGHQLLDESNDDESSISTSPSTLRVEVEEGQLLEHIVQVEAIDKDCSPEFGEVCSYEILRTSASDDNSEENRQPFTINSDGVIQNTRVLNYSESHSYVLSVVAEDCGRNKSKPLLVTVEVKQACSTGWTGLPSQVSYVPGTGPQALFSEASFSVCETETSCKGPLTITANVILETEHIGKGCDRDTYSLESQRQLCGASAHAIDLLPDPMIPGNDWASGMIRDRGQSADSSMVLFTGSENGGGYADVPEEVLKPSFPEQTFTLATWMRHKPIDDGTDKHHKEHIICKADDHRKNRHHMALFIRNCKLVLLLRREYVEGEENTFRPAEWRWKMPHVCDDEWHHYAVNVDFPEVELIVDGEKWESEGKNAGLNEESGHHEEDNPEIIDDWPLHPAGDINTKVTIGACWQGSETSYRHQLRGYLAGLNYLPGTTENEDVLKCLHQCAESLQVPAITNVMSSGMEMVVDSKGSVVKVDGKDAKDVASMVRRIAYLNTREFPVPGRRIARLETQLECDNQKTIHLEDERVDVDVISVPEPTIRISGTDDISREYEDFKLGVRIFADVHILMTTSSSSGGEPVNGIENRLDHCKVTVSPALNPDHESVEVPGDLLRSLSIIGKVSPEGAEFSGAEMIYNYERLLRQVTYTNRKPAYYLNRQFKIACSELNGRFVSNEYLQTLTVIHPTLSESINDMNDKNGLDADLSNGENEKDKKVNGKHVPSRISHRQINIHGVPQGVAPNVYNLDHEGYLLGLASRTHNNITAVIVVICVAFVGVIVILGVIRIRASHKRTAREELQAEVEMAWDDSALNIIVNPLEDDLGGINESKAGGKGKTPGLEKSSSVVGLNSSGKMSRSTGTITTTTTIPKSSQLAANHCDGEREEEGYISSSEEEDEEDEDEYTDGDDDDDDDGDCCDEDCEDEDDDENDENLDVEEGGRIIKRHGSDVVETVGVRGEREIHSMEWDNNI